MTASGLGQDGYLRIQKETTWGTAVTNSMTLLTARPDSNIKATEAFIENDNIVSSRLAQAPSPGRINVNGELVLTAHPSLLGLLLNLLFGTSTDGSETDSTYEHTWLAPLTGERVAKSFTAQQARGSATAEQYVGCMITSMVLSGDNQGNVIAKFGVVAKNYSEDVTRITSFSYPSIVSYNFSHVTCNIDPVSPTNDSAFDQLMNSFELTIDLGYDLERFKLGARTIQQPVFKTRPKAMLKMNIDADKAFVAYARDRETFQIDFELLHTEYAGGTTAYRTQIEIPSARLSPETVIENGNDRLTMDIEFDCSFGGTTTGGGSDAQMLEIRHRDGTAAYA